MLTVWGRSSSSNVQKVLWTLEELGLPYERIDCGREYGGLDTIEFRAMNPNGLIPVLKDDSLILWESNTICRYLCRTREGAHLYPEDPAHGAQVDKWMDWQIATLWPDIRPMFLVAREQRDFQVAHGKKFAGPIKKVRRNLRILNDMLADHPYLGGGDFTLADIPASIALNRWLWMDFDFKGADNVSAWYERLSTRPAFQETVKASF